MRTKILLPETKQHPYLERVGGADGRRHEEGGTERGGDGEGQGGFLRSHDVFLQG